MTYLKGEGDGGREGVLYLNPTKRTADDKECNPGTPLLFLSLSLSLSLSLCCFISERARAFNCSWQYSVYLLVFSVLFIYLFIYFATVLPHRDFFQLEIRVAFPGKSQLQQSRASQPMVHTGWFGASIIYRTPTWTARSLTWARMLIHAIVHVAVGKHVRYSTLKVDSGRKIPRRTGGIASASAACRSAAQPSELRSSLMFLVRSVPVLSSITVGLFCQVFVSLFSYTEALQRCSLDPALWVRKLDFAGKVREEDSGP